QSVVSRLLNAEHIFPMARAELERRFKDAVRRDLAYALKLFESALETPELDGRGRLLDRVLFGSELCQRQAADGKLTFSARIRGKRAFELLLALFRQGIPCEFVVREEARELRFAFTKSSLVWRVAAGETPPSIVKQLLAR